MADRFCLNCGKPIYPGGKFCGFCAAPVPDLGPGAEGASPVPPAVGPEADPTGPAPVAELAGSATASEAGPALRSLSKGIGLLGVPSFGFRREGRLGVHVYVISAGGQQPLATLRNLTPRDRFSIGVGRRTLGTGERIGPVHPWQIVGARSVLPATLEIQRAPIAVHAALGDGTGEPLLTLSVVPDGFGKIVANALGPAGETVRSFSGSLHASEQPIVDGSGTEVARIRRSTIAFGEAFSVDVFSDAEPLSSLLLAFLIELEREGTGQLGAPPGPAHEAREVRRIKL